AGEGAAHFLRERVGERSLGAMARRYQKIAHETLKAYPLNRACRKMKPERRFIKAHQIGDLRRAEVVARLQFGLTCYGRIFIPGADCETIVAAKNTVSHQRPEFATDMAFVFDRKIGDAAARIEDIGARKGFSRADFETRLAAPAMVVFGRVGRKPQIGKNRTQEEPGAKLS